MTLLLYSRRYLPIPHQLFNIVYQTEQLPLTLNLTFSPQAESAQPFTGRNIGKDRLDRRHAMAINLLAVFAVDTLLHPVRIGGLITDRE